MIRPKLVIRPNPGARVRALLRVEPRLVLPQFPLLVLPLLVFDRLPALRSILRSIDKPGRRRIRERTRIGGLVIGARTRTVSMRRAAMPWKRGGHGTRAPSEEPGELGQRRRACARPWPSRDSSSGRTSRLKATAPASPRRTGGVRSPADEGPTAPNRRPAASAPLTRRNESDRVRRVDLHEERTQELEGDPRRAFKEKRFE